VFHDLIPLDVRKVVAAFYTNPLAAEMLAWLALHSPEAKVADLAVGSGGLLVAAYRRKRALLGRLTQEDHQRFVEEQLLGVDVMPFAASVAASHIALQSPEHFTDKVNIAIWDSTDLEPDRVVPSIANIHHIMRGQTSLWQHDEGVGEGEKGAVGLTQAHGDAIQLSRYDLVIMNPPFTRQERIPEEYKLRLNERFEEYGSLSGQLGYHGYFILLADRFLNEGGRMALVIPATVLRVKSFEGVRRLWADGYHVEHIITTWHRSAFSESTRFREILLVARKGKAKDAKTTITVLKRLPETPEEAREMAEVVEKGEEVDDGRLCIRVHPYDEVRGEKNWFRFIAVSEPRLIEVYSMLSQNQKMTTLSSFLRAYSPLEDMVRGYELRGGRVTSLIINSSPEHAMKSKDVWVLSGVTKKFIQFKHRVAPIEFKVPCAVIRKTLRRAAGLNQIDITKDLDYVMVDKWNNGDFERFEDALGMRFSLDLLKSVRGDVEKRLGNVFIVRRLDISASHTDALAFYSEEDAAPTKLFWSIRVEKEHAKVLALYLNSTFNLLQAVLQRVETRGAFIELSEYVLKDFKIPDPSKLTKKQQKLLLSIFNEVSTTPLPSILEQLKEKHPVRRRIDEAWMQVLGLDVDLDWLYGSLAKEIELLKEMMREGHHS
ncbi:MAG: Eco57I restriction-modification methylase domain-containing protein, partial [Methermicoccaceae archaeon]